MPLRLSALIATLLLAPAAARAEGMPQLDFGNPLTTSQVVWGAIIFALLYVVLSRFALPRVAAVIEERARHIAADLETARASKTRADEAAQEVAEATARARAEAQAAINAALDKAKQAAVGAHRGTERAAGEAVAGSRDADQCGARGGHERAA